MLKSAAQKTVIVATSDGAKTASFNSAKVNMGNYTSFVAHLNVTAHAGTTPTLDVKFQESMDGTNWIDIPSAAFTQVTTTDGLSRLVVSNVAPYVRAVNTLGGTSPSYTYSLTVAGLL